MTDSITPLKSIVRTFLHPFRGFVTWACQRGLLPFAARKVLPHRWAHEPFTIYGPDWKCNWRPTDFDAIGHMIFWSGLRVWERETVPVILDQLRKSSCFLDIGANCGIFSVFGCTVNPTLRVIAIEPVPKTFAALTGNIQANHFESRITAVNSALGESNGIVSFHEADDATMSSMATEGLLRPGWPRDSSKLPHIGFPCGGTWRCSGFHENRCGGVCAFGARRRRAGTKKVPA